MYMNINPGGSDVLFGDLERHCNAGVIQLIHITPCAIQI